MLEARIDGFGQLQGLNCRLDAPSVVLYGMNEAGKSTLFGFIRTILYGFARRNQPAERQEPIHGGNHGGQLVFQDDDGYTYIAERYANENAGRLKLRRMSDDQLTEESWPTQEEWERRFLGGASEKMFRELYAITLTELQEVGALSHDELGRYLYHAGWENGKAIIAAEKRLQQEMEQLFKPRGTNQQMNKQLKTLEQTEQELRKQADAIQLYNELSGQLEQFAVELSQLDEELPLQQSAAQLAGKAHTIRPIWLKSLALSREREGIAEAKRISAEADLEWNELQKERSSRSYELEQLEQQKQLTQQKRETIQVDHELLARTEEVESLLLESERMQLLREERIGLHAELEADEEALVRLMRRIAPNWGEQELLDLQLTVSDREYVRGTKQLEAEAGRGAERLTADLHSATQQEREAAQLLAEAETELARAEAASSRAAIGGAAFLPQTSEAMRAAWNNCDAALREWEMERLQVSAAPVETGRGQAGPLWIGAALAGGAAVALAAAELSGGAFPGSAGAAAALGALALALAALARGRGRRAATARRPRRTRGLAPAPAAALQPREQRVRAALAALVSAPAEAAAALLAEPPHAAGAREQLRAAAEARASALQRSEQLGAGRHELARRHARLRAAAGERREAAAAAAEERAAAARQWRGWLDALALPDMSPDAALEVFELAEQALHRLQQRDRRAAKKAAADNQLAAFEARAAELCAGFPDAAQRLPAEPALGLRLLQAELRRQAAAQEEAAQLDERLQTIHIAIAAAQDKQQQLTISIQKLYEEAAFTNETEFAAVLAYRTRLEAVDAELDKLQIEMTAGLSRQRIEELEQLLDAYDGEELEKLHSELQLKVRQMEKSKSEWLDRRGRMRQQLEDLLQEDKHRELLAVKEMTIAQLSQDAERYAVLAISASLIRATKRIYEEERQPALLKLSSSFVRQLTEGRYIRVVTTPDLPSIRLETSDNKLVDSVMLSRGTAELVYLAMRLALAVETATAANMPLLLDDLFVNFDRQRLHAVAGLLCELSESRQLILFTCHEHIRDALQNHMPHAMLVQLPGARRQLVSHLAPDHQE
nr:AAA family ATPase [Paenibacillus lupini]